MPTIWHEQGFAFGFYASDGGEPPHVHVFKGGGAAKWWLESVSEARSHGFTRADRSKIRRIVAKRRDFFLEAWRDFFSGS